VTGRGLLVHEWIERRGGAERVLDAFAGANPGVDIACLWDDAPGRYRGHRVIESVLARTPLRRRKALALPALPAVWRSIVAGAPRYDWALVSSHLFAHHVAVPGMDPARQFTYVHTPARYLWNPELDARGDNTLVRAVAPLFRSLDRRRGAALRNVAANSEFVRDRIRDAWGVDAVVVHPPVGVERLASVEDWSSVLAPDEREVLDGLPDGFVLGASRFVSYKRLDVVIDAGRASGRPVVIAGGGPEEHALRAHAELAGVPVRFVIDPSDALLAALMQRAAVYVFPPVEDFGIMPVEALALGTPVVVNATGGAAESVRGVGGVLGDFSDAALRAGLEAALASTTTARVERAGKFSTASFTARVGEWTGGVVA
jgi:glycosyltransferase involved in cell wall biosynthesis